MPRYTPAEVKLDRDTVRAYAERGWDRLEAREREHWAEVYRRDGADAIVRVVEDLRAHMRSVRPDWPSAEERRRDYEHHLELKRKLDIVGRGFSRR